EHAAYARHPALEVDDGGGDGVQHLAKDPVGRDLQVRDPDRVPQHRAELALTPFFAGTLPYVVRECLPPILLQQDLGKGSGIVRVVIDGSCGDAQVSRAERHPSGGMKPQVTRVAVVALAAIALVRQADEIAAGSTGFP